MRDLQGVMPCPEAMQPVLHAGFRSVKVVIRDDGPASLREAAAERSVARARRVPDGTLTWIRQPVMVGAAGRQWGCPAHQIGE